MEKDNASVDFVLSFKFVCNKVVSCMYSNPVFLQRRSLKNNNNKDAREAVVETLYNRHAKSLLIASPNC